MKAPAPNKLWELRGDGQHGPFRLRVLAPDHKHAKLRAPAKLFHRVHSVVLIEDNPEAAK